MIISKLGKNIEFSSLYNFHSLEKLDAEFLLFLKTIDENLYDDLLMLRKRYTQFSDSYGEDSDSLIEIAKIFEFYLLELFDLKSQIASFHNKYLDIFKIFDFKKNFVNKYVKLIDISNFSASDFHEVKERIFHLMRVDFFNEITYLEKVNQWLEEKDKYSQELQDAAIFAAFLFFDRKVFDFFGSPNIFFKAKKTDFLNLIEIEKIFTQNFSECFISKDLLPIIREDFSLYTETSLGKSLHNSNYCVKCHKRGRDYCRGGEPSSSGGYTKNPLGYELIGCPLNMHISQMHELNESGNILAALIVATINNPLLAGTGANICNDCKISCIFQKQETVDTPLVETDVLKQVLNLHWGFEIYSLLTRWNPLRFYRPFPKKIKDKNILVVGLGPSGYSLAYNMALEGYGVVAIDALKIEPLNVPFSPIIKYSQVVENLDNRIIQGFGGVSEYGITSRWDKNYLKVIRIILQRNNNIRIYGGLRFGSNLDFSDVEEFGFCHLALCTGAGKPNILAVEDILAKGVKTSSEFLMSINLGAFKKDNFFNLQIRLPIVVLGGGLTAIDCATEAIVYYQRQIEKHISRYNLLPKDKIDVLLSDEDKEILEEYKCHYQTILEAKTLGKTALEAIKSLGGVRIIYHGSLEESRAYKTNFQELEKAFKQGISFIEKAALKKIRLDKYKHLNSVIFSINQQEVEIPAKTLILSIGTNPNNILQEEYSDIFNRQEQDLETLKINERYFKGSAFSPLLKKHQKYYISIFGDTHKLFNGSVVKAMASAFFGQYAIYQTIGLNKIRRSFKGVVEQFEDMILSSVLSKKNISHNIYEINISSKLMAKKFKVGQFFKIQNYESTEGSLYVSEPLMLTAVDVSEDGIIKSLVLKNGTSSSLIERVKDSSSILVMGPLGKPTNIPKHKNLMLIAGGVANATLIGIAKQAKQQGNKIIYIGGYKNEQDMFYIDEIKSFSDLVFFSVDNYQGSNDNIINGNILDVLDNYNYGDNIHDIDEFIIAGSCSMMSAVKNKLLDLSCKGKIIASSNAPMMCGLKGVCASCLQKNQAENNYFYSCALQEKNIMEIDFEHLQSRLSQNSLQEKISYLYYETFLKD